MTRKKLIAGNWKMNETIPEAVVLAQEISNLADPAALDAVDVAVCPPFVDLKPVKTVLEFDRVNIALGAQNVYWEPAGAFTGEISIPMIKEIGCTYCIVGHSERRNLFGETNEGVNLKARALIEAGIAPIVCVGESLSVRDEGVYLDFVTSQVRAAFAGMDAEDAVRAVVAYEPVWAIGTGRTATPEQAEEVCTAIRATLAELFGDDVAQQVRVLYGGSMNEGNAGLLLAQPDIDGGLIGGAALKASSFIEIVKAAR
ncbi:triose-phosphate isomerase [Adlercreutzia sp. R21]|uniref:triose-phosphate isomerase n=1 Tax=Adlercreutzia wanghongyangiae TaxID=3111451 RepID=UPI002DB697BF|nr:triose-phosphate isomerase [Adlercreutzia sp. R21]MEC4183203.1 triose-phosphate isomerase [Adlercreutzia sp. R21]